ncbi:MAG: flagellar biosynthetic protein FliO [Lachnospiraceae bacterium]|nr:flagellar biosynthetic protein FliO [Lachnospiraceae bacterium]
MLLAQVSDRAESITQFLTVFLVFILVLALTYLTTRFVGGYQKAKTAGSNFEAIETYRITNGKYLQIVKVGSKYIVIGISKDSITNICELSEDEIRQVAGPAAQSADAFKDLFEKARQKFGKGGRDNEK